MKIVVFICNWAYNIVSDIEEIAGLKVIRVMCSGRIDISLILNAFELGADGVIAFGCLKGNCHYVQGNEQAEKNFDKAKEMLYLLGIDPERLRLEFISPDESWKLEETIDSFITKLPNKIITQ